MIRSIKAATASQAYKVLFWHLMDKGERFISEDGADCRILDTVICHIDKPMEQLPELIKMSPLGPLAMDAYKDQLVFGRNTDGFVYSYYQRLRKYTIPDDIIDQIEEITHKLKTNQFTRRAIAITWQPWTDLYSEEPPCMILQKYNIGNDNKVNLRVVFRSHDMMAWPANVYGLAHQLSGIAEALNRDIGYLEIVSMDLHSYLTDISQIERLKELLK